MQKGSKQEKLALEQFELDETGEVVRLPQGHGPTLTGVGGDKIQVLFDIATCEAYPLHTSCYASAVDRKEPC